jgi:ABC-type branched-subunit amino acid transport system permease subunit
VSEAAETSSAQGRARAPWVSALGITVPATVYMILLLKVETQVWIIALVGLGVAATMWGAWSGVLTRASHAINEHERLAGVCVILAGIAVTTFFHDDHFALLLLATIILYVLAALGLCIQFGYAGVLNFAGASFFGIGGYTAAVLAMLTAMPHLLVLISGGLMAALIGAFLLYPVLRTRGHYAAVVTIAFALLFKTFLEVNDVLGGPQGIKLKGFESLGWRFNKNFDILGFDLSFYVNYVALGLLLLIAAFVLVRRLERSWIGLNLDAIRLDETASACFGLAVARWKITAFMLGNFLIGVAGALHGMMTGIVAPTSFTFGDSLILVSILLLGGIGNAWALVLATAIVIIIPEKLQAIQEYRFLIYAALVMLILLFRPDGLLPRAVRTYFPRSERS